MHRLVMACAGAAFVAAGASADTRFAPSGKGTVVDRITKLEWAGADNGSDIRWGDAGNYCEGLTLAEQDDWRLPTLKELQALYEPVAKRPLEKLECGMSWRPVPGIRLTCAMLWSSARDESSEQSRNVWTIFFETGAVEASPGSLGGLTRALCVRGGGD